jgi:TatD DNase family protein
MLIDSHAHIDTYKEEELPEVMRQIEKARILTVSVSMDVASYKKTLEISRSCSYIIPTFGIHPWEAPRFANNLRELDTFIEQTPLIGEIGLDFYYIEDKSLYSDQVTVFEYFFAQAQRLNKIVNLHTKGAEREILSALGEYGISKSIIHWYSGPVELLDAFLEVGVYFTIGCEILTSSFIQDIARRLPIDRILTETDNPGGYEWLTKVRGMPELLCDVVDKLAEVKGVEPSSIQHHVMHNFTNLTEGIKEFEELLKSGGSKS